MVIIGGVVLNRVSVVYIMYAQSKESRSFQLLILLGTSQQKILGCL